MSPQHTPPQRSLSRRQVLSWGLAPLVPLALTGCAPATLDDDEQVLFKPALARWIDGQHIEVSLHAWVYTRQSRRWLKSVFARFLGLDLDRLSPEERGRFERRCALFLTRSQSDKVVQLAFDPPLEHLATLPPTDSAGRSSTQLLLKNAGALGADAQALYFRSQLSDGDTRRFSGHALLVPEEGLSVISDIDDTVKITQVTELREMLLNTFVRVFEAAPQLPQLFQLLAARPGTRFHYLSASPFQLTPPLEEFLAREGLPAGSLHLRESTSWRTLIPSSGASRNHKLSTITHLLHDFPRRQFLLVGDSAEADPDIYADIARAHPSRILGIVIRDVHSEGRSAPRFQNSFAGLPNGLWHLLTPAGEGWPWP